MKEITFRKREPAGCPQYGDYYIRDRAIGRDSYGHERYEYALFRRQHFETVRQFRTRKQAYQYLSELTLLSRWDVERGSSSVICHGHEYLGVIYGDTMYRITKRTRVLDKRPVEDVQLTRWFDRYADCLAEAKRLLGKEA
ncbi:MAG: hypothetical protein II885_07025 [Oscillospiraceae bacterium]|nr:hypothetical protein [Oscillospiraceae bacterium]